MKTAKKVDRQLTKMEMTEAQDTLQLDSESYRWLLGIRRCGVDGCSWGKLPSVVSRRLLQARLIVSDGYLCRAIEQVPKGGAL